MHSKRIAAAALAATALVGAGGGAVLYAELSGSSAPGATVAHATPTQVATKTAALTVGEIYQQAKDGVVELTVTTSGGNSQQSSPFPGGGEQQSQAQGTGFVYDTKGHIITNQHVVDGASSVKVAFADGSTYTATVVGTDSSTDVAVIKVDAPASKLHPLTLGDSTKVAVGDGAVAIGSPFGLDETVTSGIVSAIGREIDAPDNSTITDTIQTDAAINHGNSGGPLFDMQGDVIGITSQIESDSGGNDGIGFAVASRTVKQVVGQILTSGTVKHALLGVSVQTIPEQAAQTLGTVAGVAVAEVQPGSAAADAGLKAATGTKTVAGQSYPTGGDVLTAIDGTKVTTAAQLRGVIDGHQPGDKVELTVHRGSDTRTVEVRLGSRS